MPTNLALDDRLIAEALKAGGHRTKREAVNTALSEYVRMKKRMGILELVGKVDFVAGYDPKELRKRDGKRLGRRA